MNRGVFPAASTVRTLAVLFALAWWAPAFVPVAAGKTAVTLTTLYAFGETDSSGGDAIANGINPQGLILGTNGNFYGTTESGGLDHEGEHGHGTVFTLTPDGSLTTLAVFGDVDGATPIAGLVEGEDGNFYGTTGNTTINSGSGTIFKVSPDGAFTTLHTFHRGDGAAPAAPLVKAADGVFYGTTLAGGTSDTGTIFKITSAGAFTRLYSFPATSGGHRVNADGAVPRAGLTLGRDGNFYGTTSSGGTNGTGTIFRMTPDGTLTTLNADGGSSLPLTESTDGNFYGVMDSFEEPGSVAFKITPTGALSVLHTFSVNKGDGIPRSGLLLGSDGNFYGEATDPYSDSGSSYDSPSLLYAITPGGMVTRLYAFNKYGSAGTAPVGGLIESGEGTFYGVNSEGGVDVQQGNNGPQYGDGTVFKAEVGPVITSAPTATAYLHQPFSYSITASFHPTSYGVLSKLPAGLTFNTQTGVLSGTPASANTYQLAIQATNAQGTSTATLTLTVIGVPRITSGTNPSGQKGQAFTYRITAINSPTSFSASGLPAGLSVNTQTGLISGKPTVIGQFTVVIHATNSVGTGTEKITLTIPGQPVITSAASAKGDMGKAFSYRITATNYPAKFGALGLRYGLKIDAATGVISGTPTGSGTFTLTLQAINSAGTGTAQLDVTILGVPVITSAVSASGIVDKAFSYQIKATDQPTGYSVLNLPPGLKVDDKTGLISGKPTRAGTFTLTLRVTNEVGTGTDRLTVTVKAN